MTEAEQIEQQAESLKAAWHRIARQQAQIDTLQKRCDAQQVIIDRQEQQIAQLENPITRGDLEFELLTGKGQ